MMSRKVLKKFSYWKYKSPAEGYRELTSIGGNGTQQLDTGIYPKDTTKVQSKFIYSNYGGGSLIGSQGNGEADSFRLFRHQSTTYLDYGSGDGRNRINGTYLLSTSDAYEVEFGNRYVKDIPTDTVKFSRSSVSFQQKSYTIQLTSQNDYGTFYYVKIFDGDNLISDLVPCERVSDGMVGMWDNVTNTFKEPSASFIKGEYILIEGSYDDYDFITPTYNTFTKTDILYWKEGKELNATMSGGSYNQDTGIYTVPSGVRGHIQLPETAPLSTANSWEIKTKLTYQGGGRFPCVFGYSGGIDHKAPAFLNEGGSYRLYLSSSGYVWDLGTISTGVVPQVGTTYYFKVGFTGSEYYVDYHTEGQSDYTRVGTLQNSTKVFCSVPFWFMDLSLNSNYPTYGDLDLTETSITIDGKEWWKGTKGRIPATKDDYDFTTESNIYKALRR